jgi:hypothetical protein
VSADASGLVLDCAQSITRRLLDRVDEALKADVAYWAAFYDHRLKQGNKHIFHLEGQSSRSGSDQLVRGDCFDRRAGCACH